MADNIDMTDEAPPPDEVSRSEVSLATDVMLAMVKTTKGLRMYQANNSVLEKFFQDLSEKVSAMLDQYGQYRLDVDRFELKYKGHQVYENSDPKDSIAFRMYSDGIRSVIFKKGLCDWELKEFLDIVNMNSSSSLDDDIVTRFWDVGLPHFAYILEEDYHEIDRQIDEHLPGSSPLANLTSSQLRELATNAVGLADIPDHLITLSEDDAAALKGLVEAEEQFQPLEATARILSAIVSGVAEDELFTKFLNIYLKLAGNLFVSGESRVALKMFAFLQRRGTATEPSETRKQELLLALGRLWSDDVLKGFSSAIDTGSVISPDELKSLSILIGRSTPAALCQLLGQVENMKMRKVLLDTTADFARERPQILLPFLKDSRWFVVRNMVFLLSQIRSTDLLDQVVALITHREIRVRKEVLRYLLSVPDPKAKPYILRFLRDETPSMRIMAVQLMGRARLHIALNPLLDFVASEVFEDMDIAVKKAVYEAIADIGAEKTLPVFKTMLTKKFHFQRARERDAVICAAAALPKIPGDEPLKMLSEALKSKTREHHDVLISAIDRIGKPKPADALAGQEN
ncbi:MAG: HEAT repeat domain-containing protein [Geobacteraceae bacterium]|nr:HEAT repeat domain-containing protein [Geobacteraceae bacterium]